MPVAQAAHTAAWALLDSAFRSRMHLAMLSFCCKRQETAFRRHFNTRDRHPSAFEINPYKLLLQRDAIMAHEGRDSHPTKHRFMESQQVWVGRDLRADPVAPLTKVTHQPRSPEQQICAG